MEDWDLVRRAQDGRMDAFAELVRRYQVPVVHFCQRMLHNREDAEDVAQEAFVRLHRSLARLQPQAKFSTVLFGIARNLALNHLRDSGRRGRGNTAPLPEQPLVDPATRTPEQHAQAHEMGAIIEQALALMSPQHREVLMLREFEGMEYEEIAQVLRCRKGTVKSRLARAREQLRLKVIELGGELP